MGLWVDATRRELWAAAGVPEGEDGRSELVRFHADSGRLLGRYPVPDDGRSYMLNDVVVTPDGTAWVTESLRGGLWRVRPGGDALELFRSYPHFGFANGIAASGDGVVASPSFDLLGSDAEIRAPAVVRIRL